MISLGGLRIGGWFPQLSSTRNQGVNPPNHQSNSPIKDFLKDAFHNIPIVNVMFAKGRRHSCRHGEGPYMSRLVGFKYHIVANVNPGFFFGVLFCIRNTVAHTHTHLVLYCKLIKYGKDSGNPKILQLLKGPPMRIQWPFQCIGNHMNHTRNKS